MSEIFILQEDGVLDASSLVTKEVLEAMVGLTFAMGNQGVGSVQLTL